MSYKKNSFQGKVHNEEVNLHLENPTVFKMTRDDIKSIFTS